MKFSDYIFRQVDGFNKAGKKIVKPKNAFEILDDPFDAGLDLLGIDEYGLDHLFRR